MLIEPAVFKTHSPGCNIVDVDRELSQCCCSLQIAALEQQLFCNYDINQGSKMAECPGKHA